MFFPLLAALWVACIAAAQPTAAQDHKPALHGRLPSASAPAASPYAGMEKRSVKALSEQQIADLRAGRGMGLALAAELNGYPGPLHVLEFAQALQLSDAQRMRTEELMVNMKAETITIGEQVIAGETALDRLFAERHITQASLWETISRIGMAQAELRSAHLRYHLAVVAILSSAQITEYAILRGYAQREDYGHKSR